jgi:hypothetical protein
LRKTPRDRSAHVEAKGIAVGVVGAEAEPDAIIARQVVGLAEVNADEPRPDAGIDDLQIAVLAVAVLIGDSTSP